MPDVTERHRLSPELLLALGDLLPQPLRSTMLPPSSIALYTVPYVLFPMISAVARSRSSAVNASGPSKWISLPATSPPDSASDAPGFSPPPRTPLASRLEIGRAHV